MCRTQGLLVSLSVLMRSMTSENVPGNGKASRTLEYSASSTCRSDARFARVLVCSSPARDGKRKTLENSTTSLCECTPR